jgi:tRNA (mo5U34)-methyltransferase
MAEWVKIFDKIKELNISPFLDASQSIVSAGEVLAEPQKTQLFNYLKLFMPWRKGPFNLAGIHIDTEWRSDWKWDRLKNHIDLKGKKVLDIGTGSGYHLWRMYDAGSSFVLGIEPYLRFCMQFNVIKSMTPQNNNVFMLPLTLEEMPIQQKAFDVIFSMGVLYHRKSPFDHLQQIKNMLSDGGKLVLETMIVNGDENTAFTPFDRYAKMHNVWFIPSVKCCEKWLAKCGFKNIKVVDITKTTTEEQRKTEWMDWESLSDFLNPDNPNLTIENEPAPVRAIFIAEN